MLGKREKKPEDAGGARPKRPTTAIFLSEGSAGTRGEFPPVRKKRVTLTDIARRVGVSPTTVSITLADRRDIAIPEITRDRVRRCADELGYFPSRLGEGFLRGRSKLVGLLLLSESYRPLMDCIAGIQQALAALDYIPLSMSSHWVSGHLQGNRAAARNRAAILPDLNRLLEYQVEGVLYFSMDATHTSVCVRELGRRKIPTVVLGGTASFSESVDVVGGDNEAIGRIAAEHLLSAGCTSFAFGIPKAPLHPIDGLVRSSFAARIREAGHECRDFTVDMGNPAGLAGSLSGLIRPPAGIFSVRDEVAALAMRAAFSLGWAAPRDFAVAGMGKTMLSRFNTVPVTTVNRNSFTAGEEAAKLLVRRIEGFDGPPQTILIPPTLEARQSSMSETSWTLCSTPCEPDPLP